jgi:hypothetical protein
MFQARFGKDTLDGALWWRVAVIMASLGFLT